MKTCYGVYQNSDMTEGRGAMRLVHLFSHRADAEDDAKGRGVMGHGNGEVHRLYIYDSFSEMKEITDKKKKEDLIKGALSKLTLKERVVLGVDKMG